jgi:hypothetical protein
MAYIIIEKGDGRGWISSMEGDSKQLDFHKRKEDRT